MSVYQGVKLACRLPPRCSEPERRIARALKSAGYRVEGRRILRGDLEAELGEVTLLGDELTISVRRPDPRALDGLVSVLSRECWYIDVYYYLRGKEALEVAGNLGLRLDEGGEGAEIKRLEVRGVSLKVNLYPRPAALTVSYRVGWGEANRGVVRKIHERIFGGRREAGLFEKLLRWSR